ncbi:MAG TPA: sugar phosphate isomerase/epimerase [Armatimonadetes bacterium]|nr:sugar phosphate isomerase/epimerase [Armatimonadota bacterium]
MFKLAIITDEVSQDLSRAISLAKEFGLHGLEIRSVWEKGPHELSDDEVRRIKQMAEEAGLPICCVASPFFKCDIDSEAEIRRHYDILRRCAEVAHTLGTKLVRGFAFWRHEREEEPPYDLIARHYEKALRIAEEMDIIIGLENENSTMLTNARRVVKALQTMGFPERVKAVWDPQNNFGDPDGERPFPEGYRRIRPHMVHIHMKDADPKTGEAVPIGEGFVGWREQLSALLKDGYSGFVSLETHYRPKEALPEDIAQLPKGSKFSAGGEEGSRVCLQRLFQILSEIGWKGPQG